MRCSVVPPKHLELKAGNKMLMQDSEIAVSAMEAKSVPKPQRATDVVRRE